MAIDQKQAVIISPPVRGAEISETTARYLCQIETAKIEGWLKLIHRSRVSMMLYLGNSMFLANP